MAPIEIKPNEAAAWYHRGLANSNFGHEADAVADFQQAIALKPSYPGAYLGIGKAKLNLGEKEEACNNFRMAIKSGDTEAERWLNQHCR